jgi:hypothetical protein
LHAIQIIPAAISETAIPEIAAIEKAVAVGLELAGEDLMEAISGSRHGGILSVPGGVPKPYGIAVLRDRRLHDGHRHRAPDIEADLVAFRTMFDGARQRFLGGARAIGFVQQVGDAANARFRQDGDPGADVGQQRSQVSLFFQHALLKPDASGSGGNA